VWNDPTGLSTPQNAFRYCKFLLDLFLKAKRVSDPNALVGERKDDIFLLAEYFIERYANKAGKKIRRIERKTLEWLED
jgi:transcriptional regulator with PAS, ATPase and Fis domain